MSSEQSKSAFFDGPSTEINSICGEFPTGLSLPEPMWHGEVNGRFQMNIGPSISGVARSILERRLEALPEDMQSEYRQRYADMLPRAKYIAGKGLYFLSGIGDIPYMELIPHMGILENPNPFALDEGIQAIKVSGNEPGSKYPYELQIDTLQEGASFDDKNGNPKDAILTFGIRLGVQTFEDLEDQIAFLLASNNLRNSTIHRLVSPHLNIRLIDASGDDGPEGEGIDSQIPKKTPPTGFVG